MDETQKARGGRRVFLTWFLGLCGMGTLLMALLILATGEAGWTSPVIIGLLVFSAVGVVCLVYAAVSLLFGKRPDRRGPAGTGDAAR